MVTRRHFLLTAGIAGAGAFGVDNLLRRVDVLTDLAGGHVQAAPTALGALAPTKAVDSHETVLALPPDFQYRIIGKMGDRMSDRNLTPPQHDGMAAFQSRRELRLVRNHEVNNQVGIPGAAVGSRVYDVLAGGGTTTLVINPRTREVVRDFISLSGTLVNCAGGRTPWNSWVSCEETVLGTRKFKNAQGQPQGGFDKPHGYCFEVSASANGPVNPIPLKAMGRFVHEALAVDPKSGIVYLTEDRPRCGFYRFIPKKPGHLVNGGRLQMLAIKDQPNLDTNTGQTEGKTLPVTWIDIPHPDPPEAETSEHAVYEQGTAGGGARFSRLEGCLYGRGKIYFTSTDGGDRKLGQVWEYTPGPGSDGDMLKLLMEPTDAAVLNMPDNLCLTRSGSLLICEDNAKSVHLQLLNRNNDVINFAKNVMPAYETREFAGVTFSPDGETLFVNIQVPGVTLAIWGPWDRI